MNPLDHPAPPASKCIHAPYWRGIYGTCMACRVEEANSALRRERDASRRARLVLASHPSATPAEDTGCGCAVASLEELAVAVVEGLRRERDLIGKCHEAIGESAGSDDETLPATIASMIGELRQRVEEQEGTIRREREEKAATIARVDAITQNLGRAMRERDSAVADRDRYRAALETPCDCCRESASPGHGCRAGCACNLLLAPPTPAAQESKGEQA